MLKMRLSILTAPLLCILICNEIWPTEADDPSVITDVDRKVLRGLHAMFQPLFQAERTFQHQRQYAVLYYGTPNLKASIRFQSCTRQTGGAVFLVQPQLFCIRKCNYIAGRQINPGGQHTEAIIFQSLQNSNSCPKALSPNSNMYLFTYNSPCLPCDAIIQAFINRCGNRFKRLIIGYVSPFRNTAGQSANFIRVLPQAAMTQI